MMSTSDISQDLVKLKEDLDTSFQTYRQPAGLYYTLRELYEKGKLTTWEMNTVDKVYRGFIANERTRADNAKKDTIDG